MVGNDNGEVEGAGIDDVTLNIFVAPVGDMNRDGEVSFDDLSYVSKNWYTSAKGEFNRDSIS